MLIIFHNFIFYIVQLDDGAGKLLIKDLDEGIDIYLQPKNGWVIITMATKRIATVMTSTFLPFKSVKFTGT